MASPKLSDDDVLAILELHFRGKLGYKTLAAKFDVHPFQVRNWCKGLRRRHLLKLYREEQRERREGSA